MQAAYDTAQNALVSSPGQLNPLTSASAQRGNFPSQIQFCAGSIATAMATGTEVRIGVKDGANLKGPFLAESDPLTASGTVAGLYTGSVPLNTQPIRTAMHADPSDPLPETPSYQCVVFLFYKQPADAGYTVSQTVPFTIFAPGYNGDEAIAPGPNPSYTNAQVATAIAQAAAASAAIAGVDTSAAPIQPFSQYLLNISQVANPDGINITAPLTHFAATLAYQSAVFRLALGQPPAINIANAALPRADVNGILQNLDIVGFSGGQVVLNGGTTSAPTLDQSQVNGTATLDFSAFDSTFGGSGTYADVGCGELGLFFSNTQPFSTSGGGTIGVQDSPSGDDIAAYIAANYATGTLTLSASGAVLSLTDSNGYVLPLSYFDDATTGTVCTITQAGNPPQNSHAAAMRGRGTTVLTN